ncbi:family 1 glycosylhydrolase [Pyrobaculum neutrophilum]|uniref:Glycoside hydrolase family 1 n=1 Tax=Pyrobaculum neutrophilum (strain DSM 2338 / JCM 9278 / NBRC 100436 / V24Sta) TaxID=444157 RepID=B1YD03_PYRNV|nr:family 1 glycosylhydrolase [Pyrobaculum neutrophilum]ACB39666.1 glycoside hydrolase family 1 [Pyrobaculum neutrophilum V24Sta]
MQIGAAVSPYQHFGFCRCDLPDEPGAHHLLFYEEDLDLARRLGLDAFRTGVEWALVETREGEYNRESIRLFSDYLASIKRRGLKTWVSLHHFTNPRWVWKHGGWESRHVARRFVQYVELVARELGGLIDVALLFNEPNMYTFLAYIRGDLPPYGFLSPRHMRRALENIKRAILEARDVVKSYGVAVSFTHSYTKIESRNIVFKAVSFFLNRQHIEYMQMFKEMDYTSLNYYVVGRYEDLALRFIYRPAALLEVKSPTPLAVTEFGIATRDERTRYSYLCAMAHVLKRAKPVAAIWWSFLHGYEWGLGYQPFFALVDVVGTRRVPTELAKKFRQTLENPPECPLEERNAGLEWRWEPL